MAEEAPKTGKTVLIAIDGSENAKKAFDCEYFHIDCFDVPDVNTSLDLCQDKSLQPGGALTVFEAVDPRFRSGCAPRYLGW